MSVLVHTPSPQAPPPPAAAAVQAPAAAACGGLGQPGLPAAAPASKAWPCCKPPALRLLVCARALRPKAGVSGELLRAARQNAGMWPGTGASAASCMAPDASCGSGDAEKAAAPGRRRQGLESCAAMRAPSQRPGASQLLSASAELGRGGRSGVPVEEWCLC